MSNIINQKNKLLISVIINLLFISFFLVALPLNYEQGDDGAYAQFIADGYFNIKFLNYFLTVIIGFLQKIIYPINAYVVFNLFLSFLSFVSISVVFIEKSGYKITCLVLFFLYCFFGINHFGLISFTLNPAILAVAGFLCVIHYTPKKEKWIFGTVFGSILLFISSAFRFQIFLVATSIAIVFVISYSIKKCLESERKVSIKKVFKEIFRLKRLIAFLIVLVICFSSFAVSTIINRSTPELRYYYDYTEARSQVFDYPIPDYSEAKDQYDKIDIDENDIKVLNNRYLDDEGAFSLKKLKQINLIRKDYNKKNFSIITTIKDMIFTEFGLIRALDNSGITIIVYIVLILAILFICKKQSYIVPLCFIPVIFLFYLYLYIGGKVVYRAVYVIWISCIIYSIYSLTENDIKPRICCIFKRRKFLRYAIICLMLVFSLSGFYITDVVNNTNLHQEKNFQQNAIYHYVTEKKENKYTVARNSNFSNGKNSSIYFIEKTDKNKNYMWYNATYYKIPYNIKLTESILGTDNMYDILLNDNVYFVENAVEPHDEMIKKYLQKYYSNGKSVKYKIVDAVDNYKICKFFLK